MPVILFTLGAVFMHHLSDRVGRLVLIYLGLFIVVIALSLTGPLLVYPLEPSLFLSTSGFIMMGLGSAFIEIPAVPEMIEAVEEDYKDKEEELHNFISGTSICLTGFGEALGPILGSYLQSKFGFRYTQQVVCFFVAGFFFFYFVFTSRSFFSKKDK